MQTSLRLLVICVFVGIVCGAAHLQVITKASEILKSEEQNKAMSLVDVAVLWITCQFVAMTSSSFLLCLAFWPGSLDFLHSRYQILKKSL